MTTPIPGIKQALFLHHDKHEMLVGLHEVHGQMDDLTFWPLFRQVWEALKSFRLHGVEIRSMLTAERLNGKERLYAMTQEEVDWMMRSCRRDKPVKVYRGAAENNLTGWSWTTKKDVATLHAQRCGYEKGNIVVGRLDPPRVILNLHNGREIIAFPEDVKIEKVEEVPGLTEDALHARKVQMLVEALGANHVMEMTPAAYFKHALDEAKIDRDMVIRHMTESERVLSSLGFTKRLETVRSILKEIV